ncbi:MAG: branched-chain amino acid ABC transporter permease [Anaerolineae bacterium]|nr:branched-chain amino acid ABC transporter permease [Anaerolineae bacterium]MDQ7037052.1 branched-chain amino acid ABC transporter permease [Anaerolineae bacterium]
MNRPYIIDNLYRKILMDLLTSTTVQQIINAVSVGAIYALFALGYALVFSILGVLNLAHSAIFMWGAFIGMLALDPEKAPILIAFSIAALLLSIPSILLEKRIVQPQLLRLPHQSQRFVGLIVRVVALYLLWQIGRPIYGILIGILPETMIIPAIIAFVFSVLGGGILSVILEFTAFRPLRARNAARLAQLVSSIGAALVLVNVAQIAFDWLYNRTEGYYPRDVQLLPFIPTETWIIGDLRITPIRVVILVIALGLMVALQYMVTKTQIGQQMRAVAFNQRISSLLGIDVSRVYIVTFFLAGAFGGAAGMLFGMVFLNVTPFIGESIALVGLTAIVLGGLGSINGAVLGGFIVAFIQTASVTFGGSSYRNAIVFILLFLVLLLRPQGILGQAEENRA